jgi:hypothetical protein
MELEMDKCILCADTAQERKYFFKEQPLCTMHYAEYLEVLIEEKKSNVTSSEAKSAFNRYKSKLEPTPLSETARAEKVKKEREAREKAEREEEKRKASQPAPSPYRMRM